MSNNKPSKTITLAESGSGVTVIQFDNADLLPNGHYADIYRSNFRSLDSGYHGVIEALLLGLLVYRQQVGRIELYAEHPDSNGTALVACHAFRKRRFRQEVSNIVRRFDYNVRQ